MEPEPSSTGKKAQAVKKQSKPHSEDPTKSTLKIIEGNSRLLFIAPHGFHQTVPKEKMDDDYTGEITEAVAKKLGCSAIINDTVPKSTLDFNEIKDAEPHEQFIQTIKGIVDNNEKTLVVWVHGIKDKNINIEAKETKFKDKPTDLHALIGFGQGKDPRYSAPAKTIDNLMSILSEKGMNTAQASPKKNNYCGWAINNMNQWFNKKKYPHTKVQSVQIEIRKTGFREKEHIEKTAGILATSLSALLKMLDTADPALPATKEIEAQTETQPDETLVEQAYATLSEIVVRQMSGAMLEAGNYLLKEFYGDDIERAYQKKPVKSHSLRQLIVKLHNSQDNAPSKSWIYNALNLAVDTRRFTDVSTYGNLGKSHKILLTHIHNLDIKRQLINEINENGYTVAQLKDRIEKLKEKTLELAERKKSGLNLDNLPTLSELRSLDVGLLTTGEQQAKEMAEFHKKKTEQYQQAQKKIASALADAEATTTTPHNALGEKRIVGFRDWTKPGNIVNICSGCSNDCIYCFNKAPAYRRGWVEPGHWKDEKLRFKEIKAKRKLFNGRVAFPTTHDITPKNLEAYLTVLGKLLKAGNEILIVSKPRLECIKKVCEASAFFKDEILFRFTIGATDDKILKIFEPNAPSYAERKASLEYAHKQGFKTSVSIEPMLDSPNIDALIVDLKNFVNDALWIGTLNHTGDFKKNADNSLLTAIQTVEANQTKEKIQPIYDRYKDDPKIKWKDKIKKMMGLKAPPAPGMDV